MRSQRNRPLASAVLLLLACLAAFGITVERGMAEEEEQEQTELKTYGADEARKVTKAVKHWITADHSKFEALKADFKSGPEVTRACLGCHNEAANQIHKTIHWTWKCPHDKSHQMGKYAETINNFCISVPSNEPRCTSCHIGYNFFNKEFDFSSSENIDCLVCHEQTGTYKKFPPGAGNPVDKEKKFGGKIFYPPDWKTVAQSVGRPTRKNCGTCHFNGGGGDGVKHGDLDSSLYKPDKKLDVHMNAEGANFSCVRCHTTMAHSIAGRCYKHPASEDPSKSLVDDDQITRIACASCHTEKPHAPSSKLNDHTDKVACQTCHIPEFARVKPTKMVWDWSTAGKLKDGKPFTEEGPLGKHSYDSKKGNFVWGKNVVPEYFWWNGTLDYVTLKDKIDPSKVVRVNQVMGSREDPRSRIYPFKVHNGKTPYDKGNNTMVVPHLFGKDKDAFWKHFNWPNSITAGMAYWDLPFSGEVGFVPTQYHYPTTHMVAPKEASLQCAQCHMDDGRLARLEGFYMPGRDHNGIVDGIGWIAVIGSVVGVGGHGLLRVISRKRRDS